MRTIIKNNYNQENKFLTEMYEKECNIESDTDGFKDVKKLIKNKVDKVIKAFYFFHRPCRLQYSYAATTSSPSARTNSATGASLGFRCFF